MVRLSQTTLLLVAEFRIHIKQVIPGGSLVGVLNTNDKLEHFRKTAASGMFWETNLLSMLFRKSSIVAAEF